MLIYTIRGIVSSGDNILDNEDKGALKVKMKEGLILSNIFSILLHNGIIYDVLYELNHDNNKMLNALMSGLYLVANGESIDEKAVRNDLTPHEILTKIHSLRGGALMQLAFIIPEINEPEIDFSGIKTGIIHVGLAVQIPDDMIDIFLDLDNANHNMLVATILSERLEGIYSKKELIELSRTHREIPEKIFPESYKTLLELSIHHATIGF